jgi:hypothetical protein
VRLLRPVFAKAEIAGLPYQRVFHSTIQILPVFSPR